MKLTYKRDLEGIDWVALKQKLHADEFDNGRSPQQYKISFTNSFATIFAYDGDQIVGKARMLSDGVCNAYVVDIWTFTPYRKQGIASQMMKLMMADAQGQHIYLFTDDAVDFYKKLGFEEQDIGLGRVEGHWLENESRDS
ncbi:MAG: GNAT family N-acetyltransferase [Chloroflexi bacterium]|nr:GNAT family N-acetyltransferase [Chloroflexota bacterium]